MSKEWFFLQFKPNSYHQTAKNLCQQGLKHFYPFIAPLREKLLGLYLILNFYFQATCLSHLIVQKLNGIK